jgi:hypothetical protein
VRLDERVQLGGSRRSSRVDRDSAGDALIDHRQVAWQRRSSHYELAQARR